GMSWKLGLVSERISRPWEIFSFTLAREADDILVRHFPAPTDSLGFLIGDPPPAQYLDGTGDIRFWHNIVLGESNDNVQLHKGWQLNLGEIVYIRGGSLEAPGLNYSTSGFGFRTQGIFKLVESLNGSEPSSPILNFVANHL